MGKGKKRKAKAAEAAPDPGEDEAAQVPEEAPAPKRTLTGLKDPQEPQQPGFRNKEKTLVVCSRSIIYRYRHLMMDLIGLMPHSKKDVKLQAKDNKNGTLNEIAELRGCTSCLYFECRKRQDLYLWMTKFPGGPSIKFLVNAVHTMAELKLTGNHLKGSRPILTFSSSFDKQPHLRLIKEMFIQIFGTPKDHRKSKPFFDHVLSFTVLDKHIWFRNYQISVPHHDSDKLDRASAEKMTLIEVGPRFCLNPIKIFSASMGGKPLYENPFYTAPNMVRSLIKRKDAKYKMKVKARNSRKAHVEANALEPSEFAHMWRE
ncbi:ribosome biogenesis protein BRX1 homolog 1 [Selaginella moellendorffii]|nr:ribosome biogenesis protein BRX1 homolog 1 [Selaginella moellendorffii]|eukprot:XP_002986567.2 ribosome biogenesis protein BRX1 homolog 1 [Selaginella moellendorffii]